LVTMVGEDRFYLVLKIYFGGCRSDQKDEKPWS
jgi:hypothetical protein